MSQARLIVVSGKGGVGKSTVAAAIALAASRRELATVIVEVAERGDAARLLGSEPAGDMRELELRPRLWHVTVQREAALEEYLRQEVPGPIPAGILAHSHVFELFTQAAPGMNELLTIGKVWELAQHPRHKRKARTYDVVVLDGPATGQLIGLLTAPRTFSAIARVGPVAHQGREIDRTLRDPSRVSVIAVANPEQMAVSETVALRDALSKELGLEPSAVIVNRMFPARFGPRDASALAAAPDDPAVSSARWVRGRVRSQQAQMARLRRAVPGIPARILPFRFSGELSPADLESFARRLSGTLP